MKPEYIVIGGGVVGCAVAYGLLKAGHQVTVLDGGDSVSSASRGNFGLVWLSSKGLDAPHYAAWTRRSIKLWKSLADELENLTGEKLNLVQNGGYDFHFCKKELLKKVRQYDALKEQLGTDYPYEIWDQEKLKKEEPQIGSDVVGAIFGEEDGHLNPLNLLKAYTKAIQILGGRFITDANVTDVLKSDDGCFIVSLENGNTFEANKVILSAGLGAAKLGPKLGFIAPINPQKGQVLITEKLPPMLKRPSGIIRQVSEGGIQIGDSKENMEFNEVDTVGVTSAIAERAIKVYPFLSRTKLIRSWGALRIVSPDGLPIYQQSDTNTGAYFISCHSGITLAAAHSYLLPNWLEPSTVDVPDLELFSEQRFKISTPA
ncbi:NAD(P)/FAD-dependent oxidoreductase [Photobacterium sp. DNB23_23_1]